MKAISFFCILFFLCINMYGQVSFDYGVKKVSDTSFELRIRSHIEGGWHIYSQDQPKNAIGSSTYISFCKNPLIKLQGKAKELGQMDKRIEPVLHSETWSYSGVVEFAQLFTLRRKVKTSLCGEITYQACTDEKCLPPATVKFVVPVQ